MGSEQVHNFIGFILAAARRYVCVQGIFCRHGDPRGGDWGGGQGPGPIVPKFILEI